jgi:hypothetical protein
VIGWPRPNYRMAKPLFIREASSPFGHTHTQLCNAQALEDKLLQLGVTSRRVFGLSLGISWLIGVLLFLVKEYRSIFCSVFRISILRKFLLGFLPHEGFPG